MRIRIEGAPTPEVAAAITASVQALMTGAAEAPQQAPAWQRAALAEGVRRHSPPPAGPAWAAPGPKS